MSAPATGTDLKGFKFNRNLSLMNQNASLGFEFSGQVTLAPDVVKALASNTEEFPKRDIDLAEVGLSANTDKPIEFARGSDKISFTASGSTYSGLGVYQTGAALLKRLGDKAEDFSLEAVEFGDMKESLLAVLRWGFSGEGKASGAMALGPVGSATLSVTGSGEGLFGVIRRMPAKSSARSVVQETLDSWILPKQITSVDQVQPGTWIVAEVVGGIGINLGAALGYDFNWVREAKLGGLTGDIGLRLQMGINAAVGFSSSGRCAVVVSRDTDAKELRVRLFRLKTRELDLSCNARVSVTAIDTLLPGKVDDFIAAVFDTHGQQLLRDLKVIEQWTDQSKKLSDLLAEAGVSEAENLIARLAGVTPVELQENFDKVHATAVSFITKWHALPHSVSSVLLKLVEEKVNLTDVRSLAKDLSTITADKLRSLLDTQLNRIDFFHSPTGRFLEAAADKGVLSLLEKSIGEVQDIGKKTLAVLDGSLVEDTLTKFQTHVETELGLNRILQPVTDTDFATLDAWLKRKLADFLGQQTIVKQDLEKIRKTVQLLLDKRKEYYDTAIRALHRKYNFALNAAYQSTTTDQALLDATFDFSHDPASVADFFQQAVQGKLDQLLTNQPAQVRIATGKISHGVKRQTQIDVSLPFMSATQIHVNLSQAEAVANGGGLLFKLTSSDTVASNERKSVLSLALALAKADPKASAVRLHQESLELNYTMLFAKRDMQLKHVRAQVGPAAQGFFKTKIPDFAKFLDFIDQHTEESIPNGPNRLGSGLIALEVSLSATTARNVGEAWLSLPADKKSDVYVDMSAAIQASLKRNVHDSVFSTPEAYNAISPAQAILVYCALAPKALKLTSGLGFPYWNFVARDERRGMMSNPQTVARMTKLLEHAQEVLKDEDNADFFLPTDAAAILAKVDADNAVLQSLLFSEAEVIKHAFEGGVKLANAQGRSPSETVLALTKFGAKLTEAFNSDISTLLGPGIQTLGTKVLLDASRALDPARAADIKETNAMLNLEFLKPSATFDARVLLDAGRVSADQLAFADRVVELQLPGVSA